MTEEEFTITPDPVHFNLGPASAIGIVAVIVGLLRRRPLIALVGAALVARDLKGLIRR